jgi:hypothetical protein
MESLADHFLLSSGVIPFPEEWKSRVTKPKPESWTPPATKPIGVVIPQKPKVDKILLKTYFASKHGPNVTSNDPRVKKILDIFFKKDADVYDEICKDDYEFYEELVDCVMLEIEDWSGVINADLVMEYLELEHSKGQLNEAYNLFRETNNLRHFFAVVDDAIQFQMEKEAEEELEAEEAEEEEEEARRDDAQRRYDKLMANAEHEEEQHSHFPYSYGP